MKYVICHKHELFTWSSKEITPQIVGISRYKRWQTSKKESLSQKRSTGKGYFGLLKLLRPVH